MSIRQTYDNVLTCPKSLGPSGCIEAVSIIRYSEKHTTAKVPAPSIAIYFFILSINVNNKPINYYSNINIYVLTLC